MKRSDTQTIIKALRALAVEIQSGDGVANAAIAEAADRMEELNSRQLATPVGETSDGYHTFNELYEHRHALFLCLISCNAGILPTWISKKHDDGSFFPGWFIAGIELDDDGTTVSYHLPDRLWNSFEACNAKVLKRAPKWDGHTSKDTIIRLMNFAVQQ